MTFEELQKAFSLEDGIIEKLRIKFDRRHITNLKPTAAIRNW
jgi:hypothetical protein